MKLQVFSDIHSDTAALERLVNTDADYYFAAGDLVNWARGFDKIGPILKKRADRMYVIPGNHESDSDIARLCDQYGLNNFHGKSIEVEGYTIAGLGYSNTTPFDTPGEYTEDELARRLTPFESIDPLIMVCHCPPLNTKLDRAAEGLHFGSKSIRNFIEKTQPEYFFCGHIHEAAGVSEQLGRTTAMNVGRKGYWFELASPRTS